MNLNGIHLSSPWQSIHHRGPFPYELDYLRFHNEERKSLGLNASDEITECNAWRRVFEKHVGEYCRSLGLTYGELGAALGVLYGHSDFDLKHPYYKQYRVRHQYVLPDEWKEYETGIKSFPYFVEVHMLKQFCDEGRIVLEPYAAVGWSDYSKAEEEWKQRLQEQHREFMANLPRTQLGWICWHTREELKEILRKVGNGIDAVICTVTFRKFRDERRRRKYFESIFK